MNASEKRAAAPPVVRPSRRSVMMMLMMHSALPIPLFLEHFGGGREGMCYRQPDNPILADVDVQMEGRHYGKSVFTSLQIADMRRPSSSSSSLMPIRATSGKFSERKERRLKGREDRKCGEE